jgi:hypothetical protein
MHRLRRPQLITRITSCCFFAAFLFAIRGEALPDQRALLLGAKFEVVSVRVLSDQEAADRTKDFIGPNVAVRLRLSCSGSGFYFYTWGDNIAPAGYSVKVTDNGLIWLNKMPGHTDQRSSPGIEKLNGFVPEAWRLMTGHSRSSVEWEELDSTSFAGEKHAFTGFIKINENDRPMEIVSDPYVVPNAPAPTK